MHLFLYYSLTFIYFFYSLLHAQNPFSLCKNKMLNIFIDCEMHCECTLLKCIPIVNFFIITIFCSNISIYRQSKRISVFLLLHPLYTSDKSLLGSHFPFVIINSNICAGIRFARLAINEDNVVLYRNNFMLIPHQRQHTYRKVDHDSKHDEIATVK